MKHTKAQDSESLGNEDLDSDFALEWDISQLKADFVMEFVEGQLAMRVVYWFLYTHKDMLENVLSGEPSQQSFGNYESKKKRITEKTRHPYGQESSQTTFSGASSGNLTMYQAAKASTNILKIAPRIRTTLKPANVVHDFHYVNKYRTFDEVIQIIIKSISYFLCSTIIRSIGYFPDYMESSEPKLGSNCSSLPYGSSKTNYWKITGKEMGV